MLWRGVILRSITWRMLRFLWPMPSAMARGYSVLRLEPRLDISGAQGCPDVGRRLGVMGVAFVANLFSSTRRNLGLPTPLRRPRGILTYASIGFSAAAGLSSMRRFLNDQSASSWSSPATMKKRGCRSFWQSWRSKPPSKSRIDEPALMLVDDGSKDRTWA